MRENKGRTKTRWNRAETAKNQSAGYFFLKSPIPPLKSQMVGSLFNITPYE